MKLVSPSFAAALFLFAARYGASQDAADFVPLFNGKDLTGWVNVNCDPSTCFVKDGMIVTTGKPTGFLRTDRQYENFVLEFDWMHQNKKDVGNSGLFVWGDPLPAKGTGYTRGIEVQVLVNLKYVDKKTGQVTATSHGDLFSIWGATCKPDRPHPLGWPRCLPSEERCKGGGEWNHYKVTANDGAIKLEVNGKEVSGVSECNPRKGYLALESEGAECWFKNLMIKELPSTNPRQEQIADEDRGLKSIYNGLNLSGWKANEATKKRWKALDGRIAYKGNGEDNENVLWTEKSYHEFVIQFDWRSPTNTAILKYGDGLSDSLKSSGRPNEWVRAYRYIANDRITGTDSDRKGAWARPRKEDLKMGPIGFEFPDGAGEVASLFILELK